MRSWCVTPGRQEGSMNPGSRCASWETKTQKGLNSWGEVTAVSEQYLCSKAKTILPKHRRKSATDSKSLGPSSAAVPPSPKTWQSTLLLTLIFCCFNDNFHEHGFSSVGDVNVTQLIWCLLWSYERQSALRWVCSNHTIVLACFPASSYKHLREGGDIQHRLMSWFKMRSSSPVSISQVHGLWWRNMTIFKWSLKKWLNKRDFSRKCRIGGKPLNTSGSFVPRPWSLHRTIAEYRHFNMILLYAKKSFRIHVPVQLILWWIVPFNNAMIFFHCNIYLLIHLLN